jgi:transcriptional regulator with XRE-family HTH domain
MKTLSQLIAEQREQQGLTQAQLSALAGINQAHISRIENGKSKPTMPTVFRICKALAIDPIILADRLAEEFRYYAETNFSAQPLPPQNML